MRKMKLRSEPRAHARACASAVDIYTEIYIYSCVHVRVSEAVARPLRPRLYRAATNGAKVEQREPPRDARARTLRWLSGLRTSRNNP